MVGSHDTGAHFRGPILFGAGGTGGHMFPAQAVAEELVRRNHEILLITDDRGMRYASQFPTETIVEINAANPSKRGILNKAGAALVLARGMMTARKAIKTNQPIAAIGFGGYPSLPAMQAAAMARLPYGLHEQNSLLGRANRFLAGKAAFIAHGFPVLRGASAKILDRLEEVGNPIRDTVKSVADSPYVPPSDTGPIRLLITGGSQGASLFSEVPVQAISALPNHLRSRLEIIHQVRDDDRERVQAAYLEAEVRAEIAPFFTDLPERMAQCHLLIARAGASTVTEIAAIGRPSILVPLAIAMDDHQTDNARVLADGNAAHLLPEDEVTVNRLRDLLTQLLTSPEKLAKMAESAKGKVKLNAASAVADLLETAIAGDAR